MKHILSEKNVAPYHLGTTAAIYDVYYRAFSYFYRRSGEKRAYRQAEKYREEEQKKRTAWYNRHLHGLNRRVFTVMEKRETRDS